MKTLRPRVEAMRIERVSSAVEVIRNRGRTWRTLRLRVFARAQGMCECEQCKGAPMRLLASEVDHVVPLWAGGTDDMSNLQALSAECHARKTASEAARFAAG